MGEKKEFEKNLKGLFKSSTIIFMGIFISKVLTYVYRIVVARFFGAEDYGTFSLATAILTFFVTLAGFGLYTSFVKFIPEFKTKKEFNKARYFLKFAKNIFLVSGIFFGLTLYFSSEFIARNIFDHQGLIFPLKLFSILVFIRLFVNFFTENLIAFEKIIWFSILENILPPIFRTILILGFIFIGIGSNSIYYSYFLGAILIFIISFFSFKFYSKKILKESEEDFEKNNLQKIIFKFSFPLIFTGILLQIYSWIDTFTIGYFLNVSEVGFYNAAYPLAGLLLITPSFFVQIFFPLINKEYAKKNHNSIRQLSKQLNKWIFMINVPIFLLLMVFPGSALNLLFGSDYLVSENALKILSFGAFFGSILFISRNLVLMSGKTYFMLINTLITAGLNLLLNILLVPRLGIEGAALSTSAVWILLGVMLTLESKYTTQINPLNKKNIKILIATIIPFSSLILFTKMNNQNMLSFIFLTTFFILSYIVFLIFFKCYDSNDKIIIEAIKNFLKRK